MNVPIFLVRHGAIENGFYHGKARIPFPESRLQLPLSPDSHQKLNAAAAQLPPAPARLAWFSSHVPRARQSAELLVESYRNLSPTLIIDPTITILDGGQEQNFGDWNGKTWSQIEEESPDIYESFWRDAWTTAPPGGECLQSCSDRIRGWFEQIHQVCSQTPLDGVVMISHAGVIRILVTFLQQLPPRDALTMTLELPHWSVTKLTLKPPNI